MTRRSRRTSIADVARRAGCALGSASKVLNGIEGVSPDLQERVKQAAEELGYIPNRSARMLKSGRTWRLGLVLPFASDLFYSRLLDAYHEAAHERGYRLEIHFHQWNVEEEELAIRDLIESGVEGVIIHSCHYPLSRIPYRGLLEKHHIRYAIKNVLCPGVRPMDQAFFLDLEGAAQLLTEHLIALGHRKIAALIPGALDDENKAMMLRLRGITDTVKRHPGVRFQPLSIEPSQDLGFSLDGGHFDRAGVDFFQKYMQGLISRFTKEALRNTAVITFNQMTAWRLIEALRDEGLSVPEDISVVSIGLSHIDHFAGFPLTTAEFSPIATARVAISIALGEQIRPVPIAPSLVCRRSSAAAPALVPA